MTTVNWVKDHPVEMALLASAILNILFRLKTAQAWVAWLERFWIGRTVTSAIRAFGMDPAGFLDGLRRKVDEKAGRGPGSGDGGGGGNAARDGTWYTDTSPETPVAKRAARHGGEEPHGPHRRELQLPSRQGLRAFPTTVVVTLTLACMSSLCASCLVRDGVVRPDWSAIERGVNVACLLQNAFLPQEEALMRLCDVAPDALPLARRIVGEHKAGVKAAMARAGAGQCLPVTTEGR